VSVVRSDYRELGIHSVSAASLNCTVGNSPAICCSVLAGIAGVAVGLAAGQYDGVKVSRAAAYNGGDVIGVCCAANGAGGLVFAKAMSLGSFGGYDSAVFAGNSSGAVTVVFTGFVSFSSGNENVVAVLAGDSSGAVAVIFVSFVLSLTGDSNLSALGAHYIGGAIAVIFLGGVFLSCGSNRLTNGANYRSGAIAVVSAGLVAVLFDFQISKSNLGGSSFVREASVTAGAVPVLQDAVVDTGGSLGFKVDQGVDVLGVLVEAGDLGQVLTAGENQAQSQDQYKSFQGVLHKSSSKKYLSAIQIVFIIT
jgi:hypothetical protein